jgi:hypothetical protein
VTPATARPAAGAHLTQLSCPADSRPAGPPRFLHDGLPEPCLPFFGCRIALTRSSTVRTCRSASPAAGRPASGAPLHPTPRPAPCVRRLPTLRCAPLTVGHGARRALPAAAHLLDQQRPARAPRALGNGVRRGPCVAAAHYHPRRPRTHAHAATQCASLAGRSSHSRSASLALGILCCRPCTARGLGQRAGEGAAAAPPHAWLLQVAGRACPAALPEGWSGRALPPAMSGAMR